MIRCLLVSFLLLGIQSLQCVTAQTASIDAQYGTSANIVMGTLNYHVSEYLYYNSEIGASNFLTTGTAINRVEFSVSAVGTPTTFTAVKVYMQNVAASTTTLAASTYSTTGYTLVYTGSYSAPVAGWAGIDLATPFVRTSGSNLLVMVERQDNATHTGYIFNASNTSGAVNSRRYNGTAALTSTTSLTTSAFRASIRLKHALANDGTVSQVLTFGKLLVGAVPATVNAVVTNNGNTAIASLPVTLTVTGANSYTASQTVTSLAAGASTSVSFTGYNPTALGNNTITVSVPADDDNTNNSVSYTQTTVNNAFSYATPTDTATSSIGYNLGSGTLAIKTKLSQARTLTGVRFSLSNTTSNTGNVVYGVLSSSTTGNNIAQTANYTIASTDLGNNITLNFTTPIALNPDSTYLIGIAQTANATTGYFPLNVQTETPGRAGAYYGVAGLTGGTPTEYTTLGRFMIDALFNPPLPVSLLSFTGQQRTNGNSLTWITVSEANNTGFELQRSADGINFSALSFVATKATNGNSNAGLTYSYTDEKPFTGSSYYRLKQIDKDGKSTLSNIVLIKGLPISTLTVNTIYPNPVKNSLNVVVANPVETVVTLTIADFSGKILSSQTKQLMAGENRYQLNTAALATGNYLLKITDSKGETITQRFTKQ